jgi:hypothetical protein
MDTNRFPELVKQIYSTVSELEKMFHGRHFTPDGHMVGSIGEAIAAHYYGLSLLPASNKGYDAVKNGRNIEIKATQKSVVAFRSQPDYVLVLKIHSDGSFTEIYNGAGRRIWDQFVGKKIPSNGQFQITINKLLKLNCMTTHAERIERTIV